MIPINQAELLSRREFALDLSLLELLPSVRTETEIVFFVTAELDALLGEERSESDEALIETMAAMATRRCGGRRPERASLMPRAGGREIAASYRRLRSRGTIRILAGGGDDREEESVLLDALPESRRAHRRKSSDLKSRARSFTRRYLAAILAYSRRVGTAILMSGDRLLSYLRGRAILLELPSRVSGIHEMKLDLTNLFYREVAGAAVRFFVALVLDKSSALGSDVLTAADMIVTYVDP